MMNDKSHLLNVLKTILPNDQEINQPSNTTSTGRHTIKDAY